MEGAYRLVFARPASDRDTERYGEANQQPQRRDPSPVARSNAEGLCLDTGTVRVTRLIPAQALLVASLVATTALPVAHAHASRMTQPQPPPPPGSRSFEEHYKGANEAHLAGDVDNFLVEAESALQALTESEASHAQRADVMLLVGAQDLDALTEAQLQRSVKVLDLYIDQLQRAHGRRAPDQAGWPVAQQYRDRMGSRLELRSDPPLPPRIDADPPPPAPLVDVKTNRARRQATAMIAGGGAAIGVGAILLAVGATFIPRWQVRADEYEDVKLPLEALKHAGLELTEQQMGEQKQAWQVLTRARARTLAPMITGTVILAAGVTLTVIGVRKRKNDDARLTLDAGSVRVRF